jgi:hypothetical protein
VARTSPPPPAPSPPPATREALLATAGAAATEVYGTARRFNAELETNCPWDLLYGARDNREGFLDAAERLVEQVHRLPQVAAHLDRSLTLAGVDESTREEIGFFFGSVHAVLSHDLDRLHRTASRLAASPGRPSGDEIEEAAGLASDVLGKCIASLAGVATSIAAEGRWAPDAVGAVLFPERASEQSRSLRLLEDLRALIASIAELPQQLDVVALREAWRTGRRVDRYALTPLVLLRAQLARLLDPHHRRALYTGDFHAIQRRERRLAQRLIELDRLHFASWEGRSEEDPEAQVALGASQAALLTEAAAVIDADLLAQLIGEPALRQLRADIERANDRQTGEDSTLGIRRPGGAASGDYATAEELESLVPLVADEDLDTLLHLLLGTVQKRSSVLQALTVAAAAPAIATHDATPAATAGGAAAPAPAAGPGPVPGLRPELLTASGSLAIQPSATKAERDRAIKSLHDWLEQRLVKGGTEWNAFRMIARLVGQRGPIPPAMFATARGFASDLQRELVPMLRGFTALGPLANELSRSFEVDSELIARDPIDPAAMRHQVPQAMRRIQEQLEALRSATTSLMARADKRG